MSSYARYRKNRDKKRKNRKRGEGIRFSVFPNPKQEENSMDIVTGSAGASLIGKKLQTPYGVALIEAESDTHIQAGWSGGVQLSWRKELLKAGLRVISLDGPITTLTPSLAPPSGGKDIRFSYVGGKNYHAEISRREEAERSFKAALTDRDEAVRRLTLKTNEKLEAVKELDQATHLLAVEREKNAVLTRANAELESRRLPLESMKAVDEFITTKIPYPADKRPKDRLVCLLWWIGILDDAVKAREKDLKYWQNSYDRRATECDELRKAAEQRPTCGQPCKNPSWLRRIFKRPSCPGATKVVRGLLTSFWLVLCTSVFWAGMFYAGKSAGMRTTPPLAAPIAPVATRTGARWL